jgi:hypothetical protein
VTGVEDLLGLKELECDVEEWCGEELSKLALTKA